MVCKPTCLGGLGILDLWFFGFTLRLRWEWLHRTQPERCWTLLPSRTEKNVAAMCAISLSVVLGDGRSARMWTDSWAPVGPLRLYAPDLFAAVSRSGRQRTVQDALQNNCWVRDVVGALTTHVYVWRLTREVALDPLLSDRFVWKWSPDGTYSASSTYHAFLAGSTSLLGARSSGRLRHRRGSNSSSGSPCTGNFGPQIVGNGMPSRTTMNALSAAKKQKL